jgi:hypothetical protein
VPALPAVGPGETMREYAAVELRNQVMSSVIGGPRTVDQRNDYLTAVSLELDDDEALVDSLVTPGYPSTPGCHDLQYLYFGRIVD